MRLPTREGFDAVEFALWSTFKILLMLLAMVAVVVAEAKHIWWGDRKKGRANRVAGCRMVGCQDLRKRRKPGLPPMNADERR